MRGDVIRAAASCVPSPLERPPIRARACRSGLAVAAAVTLLSLVPAHAWAWCELIYHDDVQTDGTYVWYDVVVGFNAGGQIWTGDTYDSCGDFVGWYAITPYYEVTPELMGPNGQWGQPQGGTWWVWAYVEVPVYQGGFGDYIGTAFIVEYLCSPYYPQYECIDEFYTTPQQTTVPLPVVQLYASDYNPPFNSGSVTVTAEFDPSWFYPQFVDWEGCESWNGMTCYVSTATAGGQWVTFQAAVAVERWIGDQVVITVQDPPPPPPTLSGPTSIVRGQLATFTIQNPSGSISGWRYDTSEHGSVIRVVGDSSTTWWGTMVASGTVRVTVGGTQLQHPVTVVARSGPDWQKVPPSESDELPGGTITCGQSQTTLPNPPTSSEDHFGFSCEQGNPSGVQTLIADDGPNRGFRYVTSVDVSAIRWRYIITPALADTGSPFYQCQTGVPPIISGDNLAAGTRRHEGGSANSHYAIWRDAWGDTPQNNFGLAIEAVVGRNVSEGDFEEEIRDTRMAVSATLHAAQYEPCGVNWNASCTQSMGQVNYNLQSC